MIGQRRLGLGLGLRPGLAGISLGATGHAARVFPTTWLMTAWHQSRRVHWSEMHRRGRGGGGGRHKLKRRHGTCRQAHSSTDPAE